MTKTLFDPPTPAVRDSPTSVAAGESMAGSAALIRSRVLAHIHGHYGATCDECEVGLGLIHQTCSARCRELVQMGLIRDSGVTRKTRSNRSAVVWISSTTPNGERP